MTRARELADLLTGGQTIETDDNTTQLTLQSTDADSSVGPVLDLVRDSASPADGDAVGQIKYIADNDAGEATTYSSAFTTLRDASDGAEDGQVINYVITGGSLVDHLRMGRGSANGQSEVVINEGSADIDFRVESDNDANAFFVQGSSGNVGIGNSSPGTFTQNSSPNLVVGTGSGSEGITVYSGNDASGCLTFADGTSGAQQYAGFINYNHDAEAFQVGIGGSERFRFTTGGIAIGGTGSANTLDDFEEGDWTPSIGNSSSYGTRVGKYTKVGRLVSVVAQVLFVQSGSSFGEISGFPFAVKHALGSIVFKEYNANGLLHHVNIAANNSATYDVRDVINNSLTASNGTSYGFNINFTYVHD